MTRPMPAAVPAPALDLAAAFAAAGWPLYLVGGWVRDALIGRPAPDLDFATPAPPAETQKILTRWAGTRGGGNIWTTGFEFGTVAAQKGAVRVEVTTFRTERYEEGSRNPTVVFASELETDLSRRDFTINALAIALPEVQLIDPFGGLGDLAQRRIRTPLSPEISFGDDPLRMLRALRFASTLDFRIEPEVLDAIAALHGRLAIVSAERIRDEFSKLLCGQAPSAALRLATEVGLADEFLPELGLMRLEQDPIHRHKDVFAHTLAVLDNAIALEDGEPDLIVRLAAVLHDIGKPRTREITPEGVTFHHHEVVGAEMAQTRLRALRYPTAVIADARQLVYLHLRLHSYGLGWTDKAVRRYVRDAGPLLGKLNTLVRSDCTTRNPRKAAQLSARIDELEARIRELAAQEELMALRPALDGHQVMAHLGITPGPRVGKALDFLMEIRLDEGEIPEEEAYRRLDEWWASEQAAR
ncbi:MAG TPA: CCA tRNA nucleotidyltransferase [Actinomycetota bacterium]|nr:CCA tRNA nucleotidyltransferase [Actinomycetota bacterium]